MSDERNDSDPLADPGHLFDQTNGVVEGLDGDADGTAGSDTSSTADRELDADPDGIDQGSELLTEGRSGTAEGTDPDR